MLFLPLTVQVLLKCLEHLQQTQYMLKVTWNSYQFPKCWYVCLSNSSVGFNNIESLHSTQLISDCDAIEILNSRVHLLYFNCFAMFWKCFCVETKCFCLFCNALNCLENICFEFTPSYPAYVKELITLNRFILW